MVFEGRRLRVEPWEFAVPMDVSELRRDRGLVALLGRSLLGWSLLVEYCEYFTSPVASLVKDVRDRARTELHRKMDLRWTR